MLVATVGNAQKSEQWRITSKIEGEEYFSSLTPPTPLILTSLRIIFRSEKRYSQLPAVRNSGGEENTKTIISAEYMTLQEGEGPQIWSGYLFFDLC